MSRGKVQAAALDAVCEFALSLFWTLPNVICDEERIRYQEDQLGGEVQRDKITAKVRYEDGREQYSEITINGKSAQAATLGTSGAWSEGEFAEDLRSVFWPQSAAEFKFSKQEVLHGIPVLVFEFRVAKKNNRLRYLQASSGATSYPGYHGRFWIDQSNLHLVRMERKVDDVEAEFPIQRADLVIDYGDVDLADGTKFVLPVQAVNASCPTVASSHCWHNQLTFKHWHKFAARARVLIAQDEPPAPPTASPAAPPTKTVPPPPDVDSISLPMDLRREISIAADTLNDELAEIERRQKQVEVALASSVAIDAGRIQPKTAPAERVPPRAAPAASVPAEFSGDQVPVLKSSVKLVLVPTVVRDSRGHTVDHLQKLDFRLLDDRSPQLITQFSLERPGGLSVASRESAAGPMTAAVAAAIRHAAYVFDDIHATPDDLAHARAAAKRHLTSLPSGDRAAIFTLSGNIALDFTDDAATLKDAIQRIGLHPLTATGSVRCPDISYVQADLIHNNGDAIALAAATADALQCAFAGDPAAKVPARRMAEATAAQVLVSGRAETQASFTALREIVRRISSMPGQRCIVLVSPGFPTAEMQEQAAEIIDSALRAQVIINVLDPSGLSLTSPIEYGSASGTSDVLVDLTSGTGGTFFHNRNDVDEGFQKTALPDLLYVLGFAPQKLDGRFHKLKVTLQKPEKLTVQARRGYYAPKPAN